VLLAATGILTDIDTPDRRSKPIEEAREEYHRELKKMFRLTIGQLKPELEKRHKDKVPEDLLEEIAKAKKWRDYLAHYYLRRYKDRLGLSWTPYLTGAAGSQRAIAELRGIREHAEAVTQWLLDWQSHSETDDALPH
jgi:hypothetical protein